MTRSRRQLLRRLALGTAIVAVAGLVGVFTLGPGVVESSRNQVAPGRLAPLTPAADRVHERLTVVDLHADTLMWDRDLLERSDRGHVDLPRLEEGNVALQVFSSVTKSPRGQQATGNTGDSDAITLLSILQLQPVRTWGSPLQRTLYHGEKLDRAARDSKGRLRVIRTRTDLRRLLADRRAGRQVTGALLSVEGLHDLEGDADNLDRIYRAGARMAGFAHFFDNETAGSRHGVDQGGLTPLGRTVLARMQRLGMVVDLSHASSATIDDVLARTDEPVVASHGGVQGTCPNDRNLTDQQIRAIADTGGIVGIGYWKAAVCDYTPAAVVDAIEHVIRVGGVGAAALGSDFDGAVVTGWDASDVGLVTQELLRRGHRPGDIEKIMGGNALRVLDRVLPV